MKQTKTSFWLIILIPLPYLLGKIPKFHLIFGCGNFVERRSLRRVSGDSSDSLWKLRFYKVSTSRDGMLVFYAVTSFGKNT